MLVGRYCRRFCRFMSFFRFLGALSLGGDRVVFRWEVVRFRSLSLRIDFYLDAVGLVFRGVVLYIAKRVFHFRDAYMGSSVHPIRFHRLLICFVISIILFIFIPNLFGLIIGWDGLGIFSFLLVLFYPCHSSLSAGLITGLTNRLGDRFLILALFFRLLVWGRRRLGAGFLGVARFRLVIGGMTKRAQFPFCSWLPRAIAAPTPVSSLVHSSTLVTAGVFLIVRYHDRLRGRSLSLLQWASLITMLIRGLNACVEYDIKKVVALSTLSQVSFIIFAVRIGFPLLGFFHLIRHAVTKALLFICVGLVILRYRQDLRRLGARFLGAEGIKWYFGGACIGLCGFPFIRGFYSKDAVIESIFFRGVGYCGFFIFFVRVLTTSYYRARLFFFCFLSGLLGRGKGGVGSFRYGGCSGAYDVHCYCWGLFLLSVGLGGVRLWFFYVMPCMFPCHVRKALILSICPFGFWAFWLLGGHKDGLGVRDALVVGRRGWSSGRERFVRELGFLDGLRGQPLVYSGIVLSERVNASIDQGLLETYGPGGVARAFKSLLNYNEIMCNHWLALFFLVYIVEVVFWIGIS